MFSETDVQAGGFSGRQMFRQKGFSGSQTFGETDVQGDRCLGRRIVHCSGREMLGRQMVRDTND